jgi:hypothetical protein
MSLVLIASIVFLLIAVVIIELRAVREGDERQHHAPGYAMVLGGLVLIGFGMAAAISNADGFALVLSGAGLASVALGTTRHKERPAH